MSEVPDERPVPQQQVTTPREWGQPWQGGFLEALARMPNVSAACRVVGVHRSRPYDVAKDDPAFRDAWKEAIEIGIDLMERIAHQRATTGWEHEETRREVERGLNENNELVVVREKVVTVTRTEVSDQMMALLLRAYRPRRFREQVEHHLGPADDLDVPHPVGPEDDGIHRVPTRERMLELARLAQELEPGVPAVIEGAATRAEDAPA